LFKALGQSADTVELPGHGRAPAWDPSQDYQTQAVNLAIAKLTVPSHIVGHSYGGSLALRLAVDRPDLVRSLVLIEPVFFKAAIETDPQTIETYEQVASPLLKAMSEQKYDVAADAFADMWGGVPPQALPPETRDALLKLIPLIDAGTPGIVEDISNIWLRLQGAKVPTLLLEGSKTQPIISSIQNGLAGVLPNSERQIIIGAGHMLPMTHPAAVANAILTFQKRN
jgi:pimeloyl-ACP methyl ester carboxylesterase